MPESERRKEGTGYRYIKARLDESYAGRWKMSSYPIDDGWETVIEIRGIHRQARIELGREKALAI